MAFELEAVGSGDFVLAAFDFLIHELENLAIVQTHHVIVMFAAIHLKHRMGAIKIMPLHNVRRLELGKHPIDGGEPHVVAGFQQGPVDVLGAHMAVGVALENLENTQSGQGGFKAGLSESEGIHVRFPVRVNALAGHGDGMGYTAAPRLSGIAEPAYPLARPAADAANSSTLNGGGTHLSPSPKAMKTA